MSGVSIFRRVAKSLSDLSQKVHNPLSLEPLLLFNFSSPDDVHSRWKASSDSTFGGCSSAQVSLLPITIRQEDDESNSQQNDDSVVGHCMRFEGEYSRQLGPNAHPRMKKSGFVSTIGRRLDSLDPHIDLECYKSIVYTVRVPQHAKGLSRTFLANIRTDNWVIGGDGNSEDIWQAVLLRHDAQDLTKGAAENDMFTSIEIPLKDFILTWRGRVVDSHVEIGKSKITALGISLLGDDTQEEGPFCLDVLHIKALHEQHSD
jgi:hypothetical protein